MELEIPIKYYRIVTKNGQEVPLGTTNKTVISIQSQILRVRAGASVFENLPLQPRLLVLRVSGANIRFETAERKFQANFENSQIARTFLAQLEAFQDPFDKSKEPVPPSQAETQASQRDLDQAEFPAEVGPAGGGLSRGPTSEAILAVLQNPQFPGEVLIHEKTSFAWLKAA